jgi:hypothetical protein
MGWVGQKLCLDVALVIAPSAGTRSISSDGLYDIGARL